MKLEGKVAIITGTTAGIGRACALLFAKEGAKVVAAGRNVAKGESLVEEIKAAGGEAIFVATDMNNEADMDNLLNKTIEVYGKLDVLYNNAGIAFSAPLAQYSMEEFDKIFAVDLRSPFLLCKKAMPYLMETKGNILNTSSISGLRPQHNGYAYNGAKTALIRLTDILATVAPEQMVALEQSIPMGRLGMPEEIAKASVFMVSDDASYMTGVSLAVDGGITLM